MDKEDLFNIGLILVLTAVYISLQVYQRNKFPFLF